MVPDLASVLLPLLKSIADNREHAVGDLIDELADAFHLSIADRREMLPRGSNHRFSNRVWWARTYLVKAGLATSGRGTVRITSLGLKVLAAGPERIDHKYLCQFQGFREFIVADIHQYGDANIQQQTPEELLEAAFLKTRQNVSAELLERVRQCSPSFFEQLVIDLLLAMGYGGSRHDAGAAIGRVGDGGVDGLVKEDCLGLDNIYVQAKRWSDTVGRDVVQAFAGSLEGYRARKGVLITTSHFSREARDYVTRIEKRIVLIDGQELADFMIDYGIGVDTVASHSVHRVRLDYFGDGV